MPSRACRPRPTPTGSISSPTRQHRRHVRDRRALRRARSAASGAFRLPHLPIVDNWNRMFGLIDDDAAYVKELHADDLLMPALPAELVGLMERHPSAGMASSYCLYDAAVSNVGLPLGSELLRGTTLIRSTLLGEYYVFGGPSQVMIRHDVFANWRRRCTTGCFAIPISISGTAFSPGMISGSSTRCCRASGRTTRRRPTPSPRIYSTLGARAAVLSRQYGPRYLDPAAYRRGHRQLLTIPPPPRAAWSAARARLLALPCAPSGAVWLSPHDRRPCHRRRHRARSLVGRYEPCDSSRAKLWTRSRRRCSGRLMVSVERARAIC